jgi:hypothetical protein
MSQTVYNPYHCESFYCGPPPSDDEYAQMLYYLKKRKEKEDWIYLDNVTTPL